MTVHDVERALVRARSLFEQLDKLSTSGLAGLQEAQRGISAPPDGGPSSAPGSKPPPGALVKVDDPARSLRRAEVASANLVSSVQSLYDELQPWHRLGLPRDDPRRKPTKEERLAAEGQDIDDHDCCQSCVRIGVISPRKQRLKLCSWCYGIVYEYGYMWPQMTMPPVELVRLHNEAFLGRVEVTEPEVLRRLEICFGTPRKVADPTASTN